MMYDDFTLNDIQPSPSDNKSLRELKIGEVQGKREMISLGFEGKPGIRMQQFTLHKLRIAFVEESGDPFATVLVD
jgi:hypothetical protein